MKGVGKFPVKISSSILFHRYIINPSLILKELSTLFLLKSWVIYAKELLVKLKPEIFIRHSLKSNNSVRFLLEQNALEMCADTKLVNSKARFHALFPAPFQECSCLADWTLHDVIVSVLQLLRLYIFNSMFLLSPRSILTQKVISSQPWRTPPKDRILFLLMKM